MCARQFWFNIWESSLQIHDAQHCHANVQRIDALFISKVVKEHNYKTIIGTQPIFPQYGPHTNTIRYLCIKVMLYNKRTFLLLFSLYSAKFAPS